MTELLTIPSILLLLLPIPILLLIRSTVLRYYGLQPLIFLTTLHKIITNRRRFLQWSTELLLSSTSPTITIPFAVLSADPLVAEHAHKTHFHNYPKGPSTILICQEIFGGGIINSDGEEWQQQRRAALLELHSREFRAHVGASIWEQVEGTLVPYLRGKKGVTFDLQEVMARFSFDMSCRAAIGIDPRALAGGDGLRLLGAFEDATLMTVLRVGNPFWRVQRVLGVGNERRMKEATTVTREFIDGVVRTRKAVVAAHGEGNKTSNDDLLSMYVAAGKPDELLFDTALNFVMAGRDTIGTAVTWLFWLVARHPAVERGILDELRSIRKQRGVCASDDTTPFTAEEARRMEYLHAAVTETLRLYPPVSLTSRTCAATEVLHDGTVARKGWRVVISAFAMGRLRSVWGEDCLEFRPERWLDGAAREFRPANPAKFPAFHAGPRACLGKDIAYAQIKAVAAGVLERFEIEVDEGATGEAEFETILKMIGGLPVRVKERKTG